MVAPTEGILMVDIGAVACPVCSQNATVSKDPDIVDGDSVECPKRKKFIAPGLLLEPVLKGQHSDSETKELLPYPSAYIRQANERREPVVVLDENGEK
jgi:hypothetical protein